MKTFARLQDGLVAELVTTEQPIHTLFHPGMVWLDVSGEPAVTTGWLSDGRTVSRPAAAEVMPAPTRDPSAELADIRSALAALQARVAAFDHA